MTIGITTTFINLRSVLWSPVDLMSDSNWGAVGFEDILVYSIHINSSYHMKMIPLPSKIQDFLKINVQSIRRCYDDFQVNASISLIFDY